MPESGDAHRVPAVRRAALVLDAVAAAARPIPLAELARATALPKTSVLAVCQALAAEGLLLRGADATYRLGPRLAQLGGAAARTRPLASRIGMVVPSSDNPFFAAELQAVREEALALQATLLDRHAAGSVDRQGQQILELLGSGIDLLLVDPVATEGLEPAFSRARAQGVPIVSMNGASAGADAAVTTDNAQAGFLAGRYLAERLAAGAVAVLDGTRVTAVADRIAGFLEALRDHGGLRVGSRLPGDNTERTARDVVAALLRNGERPDAIFAINDPSALGAAAACAEAGVAPVIVGVDGSAAAVRQIVASGPIAATVAQDPHRIGRSALRLGLELCAGVQLVQRTVLLPTRLIDSAQAPGYRSWD